jgi:ferredoxin-thioredoxin reductase catalytic subunit/rubredoxin|uniref:ferredoxin:thioredoxin reductase n=1 Tax=candidate division WOR-3 bacterium TaxID=2052148 RepID=A0A7V3UZT3_UNCW3
MYQEFSQEVITLYEQLKKEAAEGGYNLNPDENFTLSLVTALLTNEKRYGYRACPCRLALGEKNKDIDIICPCYYRDADLEEYGACYCALYVSDEWLQGKIAHKSIPERRPPEFILNGYKESKLTANQSPISELPLPVWRCKVCGYLCARTEPPSKCPVCKTSKERFERFI